MIIRVLAGAMLETRATTSNSAVMTDSAGCWPGHRLRTLGDAAPRWRGLDRRGLRISQRAPVYLAGDELYANYVDIVPSVN